MPRQRPVEEYSFEELHRLLVEKRRAERQRRLEHFRRTGRTARIETAPAVVQAEALPGETFLPEARPTPSERRKRTKPGGLDKYLLAIEIVAVLGFLYVVVTGLGVLRTLNREVASALTQPTLTPTPLVMAVVLPSGHTPPNAPGGAQPNDAEIPEHLRPLVQSLANLPIPTPGPEQAMRIQIPAIGVDAPIVQGVGWDQLKKGVGQLIGSPNPGQSGNLVLSAHNDVFGEIFRDLDRLKPGDQVIVFTSQRTFTYIIRQSQIVEPAQTEVISPSQDATLTLISCYPYLVDNKRIAVSASLQENGS